MDFLTLRVSGLQAFLKICEYGFIYSYVDYSVFTYWKENFFMALLVYVDDIMLARNDYHACDEFKSYLQSCFTTKDVDPLKYFLGIEVARGPKGFFFS